MKTGPVPREPYIGSYFTLYVSNRNLVCGLAPDIPHVVISITSPGREAAVLANTPMRRKTLRLQFYDVSGQMPEEAAQTIAQFVCSLPKEIRNIIVHCEKGISRSAAVAAAIAEATGGKSQWFRDNYMPNRAVYEATLGALSGAFIGAGACTDTGSETLE